MFKDDSSLELNRKADTAPGIIYKSWVYISVWAFRSYRHSADVCSLMLNYLSYTANSMLPSISFHWADNLTFYSHKYIYFSSTNMQSLVLCVFLSFIFVQLYPKPYLSDFLACNLLFPCYFLTFWLLDYRKQKHSVVHVFPIANALLIIYFRNMIFT